MSTDVMTSATTRETDVVASPNVTYTSEQPRGSVSTITPHAPSKR